MSETRETGGAAARAALFIHIHGELAAPLSAATNAALRLPDETAAAGLFALLADAEAVAAAAHRLAAAVDELLQADFAGADAPDMLSLRAALRHALNTPIDRLRGSIDLLLEQGAAAAPLAPALRHAAANCEKLSWAVDAVTRFATEPSCLPGLAGQPPVKGELLLIDGDAGRAALARRLEAQGHRVHAVADEEAALSVLPQATWDLVLLDLGPSVEAGLDLLCRLKGRPALRNVPVLVMATLPEVDAAGACIAAGAEDYVAKPLNGPLLYARIGASIERKRLRDVERAHLDRLQWELTTARRLQASLLPRCFPPVRGVDGHGLTVPAREVGADFFDFIPLGDGRVGIAVGDVSGKGVAASFLMGMVRGLLRIAAGTGMPPGACLQRINATLCENNDQAMFVTLVYGVVDPQARTFTYANAGHNPPLLVGTDGPSFLPSTEGPALAIFAGTGYVDATVALSPEAEILLYTDGVVEAVDPHGQAFGVTRLVASVARRRGAAVQDLVEGVVEDVRVFAAGQPLLDDIACAAVRLGDVATAGPSARHKTAAVAINLRFGAKPGEVRRLLRIVDGFCLGHGIPDRVARHLTVAVDEAVTNVIAHAFDHDPGSHEVRVRLEVDGETVRAEIEDDGRPFDPTSVHAPRMDLSLEDLPVGGLGVHLMRSLVDRIEYERDKYANRLILTKHIAAAGRGGQA
jgi:sigma-B regulation protein RsbU (phosphoserine phosphatase)